MIREEVLKYFKEDELTTDVFLSKYSLNGEETPDQMHRRLAKEFARVEKKYNKKISSEEYSRLSKYGQERLNSENVNREEEIYYIFKIFKYVIPGGSVMSGLGSNKPVCLSNCLVVSPPEDSIESIINTARDMAQLMKRRGGVGIDISNLRPNGSKVDNAAKTSSGSVSFMDLYSKITEVIGQGGRRGALMISIDINHPDILEFINSKRDLTKITGANISVRLNDEFLKAVKNDDDYILKYPCNFQLSDLSNLGLQCYYHDIEYLEPAYNQLISFWDEENDYHLYFKRVKARDVWNQIIENAHATGEPGILNDTRLTNYDPASVYKELKYVGLNPCAEQSLGAYDTCRLLATNLYSLIRNPFTEDSYFDEKLAYEVFYEALILGDNLVDLEIEYIERILDKLDFTWREAINVWKTDNWIYSKSEEFQLWWKVREKALLGRRVGSEITAYADCLAALGVSYGDPEVTENIFEIKLKAELDATIDMAILRGPFPLWDKDKEFPDNLFKGDNFRDYGNDWYEFIDSEFLEQSERMIQYGRRNVNFNTIGPTGSISILTQSSSGIEPLFQPYYTRRKKCNPNEEPDFVDNNGVGFKEFTVVHPKLWDFYLINKNKLFNEGENTIEEIYKKSPWYNQTANDINWETRVMTQALIQKYITSSISSTVNLAEDVSVETIENIYLTAFEKGCKGITVYRNNSRSGILVTDKSKNNSSIFNQYDAPKRPECLNSDLHVIKYKGIEYAVIIGLLEEKPYEVFAFRLIGTDYDSCKGITRKIDKNNYQFESDDLIIKDLGNCGNSELEKACTLYTSMLLRHGTNIHFVIKTAQKISDNIASFVSAMCRILSKYDTVKEESECPECGGTIIYEAGCAKCQDCGYSRCG